MINYYKETMKQYLTQSEVDSLLSASAKTKNPVRDKAIVLLSVRHGLRKSETVKLRWSNINFKEATIYVNRVKGSKSGIHPLQGDELRLLRKLKDTTGDSEYCFLSQYGTPLKAESIDSVLRNLSKLANMEKVNPHALRHTTGYLLINKGIDLRTIQDYLGHRNIQNTVRYTALDSNQFRNLWD
jgi:integrase